MHLRAPAAVSERRRPACVLRGETPAARCARIATGLAAAELLEPAGDSRGRRDWSIDEDFRPVDSAFTMWMSIAPGEPSPTLEHQKTVGSRFCY